jgi:hypothetical protein
MFVAATVAVMAAAAAPQLTAGIERMRAMSAARYLAGRLAFARSLAAARSANVALVLVAEGATFTSALYVDGNSNGVRMRDIGDGVDLPVGEAVRLADLFPHVVLSLTDPGGTSPPDASVLMSFSPTGTASSRTLYVRGRDGSQYAVRVLGATGRTRVLRYAPATRSWIEVL